MVSNADELRLSSALCPMIRLLQVAVFAGEITGMLGARGGKMTSLDEIGIP